MKVENSPLKDSYQKKLSLTFGNFYIFDSYVIGEVHEGVHFNWEVAKQLIELVYLHFGSRDVKLGYISNRINSYSVNAQDWLKFYKERHHLEAFAVVAYSRIGFMNVVVERIFSQTKLRKFSSISDAIIWIEQHTIETSV